LVSFFLHAGRADVEGTLGKSLSHHSWESIKIASHPKVSLGSNQTFYLPPFKACTLLHGRGPTGSYRAAAFHRYTRSR
jgi:hypothetical protein